jgi:hypothetical protein
MPQRSSTPSRAEDKLAWPFGSGKGSAGRVRLVGFGANAEKDRGSGNWRYTVAAVKAKWKSRVSTNESQEQPLVLTANADDFSALEERIVRTDEMVKWAKFRISEFCSLTANFLSTKQFWRNRLTIVPLQGKAIAK